MVEQSKLDEDKEGKVVDPSHYRGMIGTLFILQPVDLTYNLLYASVPIQALDIRFHFIMSMLRMGVIELDFVNTEYNFADIFTKALGEID
ncbi:hypothetical protein Tco_1220917 [Tanacetum coccineum]